MNSLRARSQSKIRMATVMVFLLISGMGISGMVTMAAAEDFALGDIPLDKETYEKYIKVPPPERLEGVHPSSYDARDAGIVTPAKNQGSCGSCWAFASVGALESHLLKKYSAGPYDLSEQQLLDCNTYGYSCSGGSSNASLYWESTGPITEACYSYTATKGTCSYSCTEMAYRVTGWHTVTQSELYFKDSCYNEGPSYWRFQVYSDFADQYGHGFWYDVGPGDVYINASGTYRGGHAVLLIGWDDTKNAYLCKNSWGATGGPNDDGTFWIAYTGHANDLGFGMSNFDIIDSAPTVGTPSSITVPSSDSDGSYTVSWGSSSTSSVTYALEEATNSSFSSGLRTAYSGSSTSTTITGRSSGTTYYYRVKATRSGYNDSAWRTGSNGCMVSAVTPTVTSVSPTSGPIGGTTSVDIFGSNFVNGATVSFGGTAGTSVGFMNSDRLIVTAPAHAAGTVDVTVTNPDTQSGTLVNGYTYVDASSVIYVNKDDGTCGGKIPCYALIQDAINAASTGAVIRIAQGIYSESINLNTSKSLILNGGWNYPFTSQTSNTTFIKAPKATQGSLTMQELTIKP